MEILNDIKTAVIRGSLKNIKTLTQSALDGGLDPLTVLNDGFIAGMDVVGERFRENKVFIPEVMLSAKTMNSGVELLEPLLKAAGSISPGKACVGTVKGDRHDIGKNLVAMMFKSKGIEVIDLGVDVPAERFVAAVRDEGCTVVGLSALLTTTMPAMKEVVDLFAASGMRDKAYIMIGGAPVTAEYCARIGADAYTSDASAAANKAYEYLVGIR